MTMIRQHTTRQQTMRRTTMALVLGLLAMLVLTMPAAAGVSWCRTDPVIEVNGRKAHIYISKDANYKAAITGPTVLVVHVPKGSSYRLIEADNGFGFGYAVTFVEDSKLVARTGYVDVRVQAYVPADDSAHAVRVELHPDDPAKLKFNKVGTANMWFATGTARI